MSTPRRAWSLAVIVVALSPSLLLAQDAGRWACRVDSLSGYNCARYYDGTVTLTSELRGPGVHQTFRIVATVAGGRVTCQVSGSEVGEFTGPGMLAVAHEAARVAGGGYEINVWCPQAAGDTPHRGSSPSITIMHQRAADYAALEGRDEHAHADADEANRISGTETITWTLRRP